MELDLATVEPSLAGPRRPQDRVPLAKSKQMFHEALPALLAKQSKNVTSVSVTDNGNKYDLAHGSVVIAAITSCTNTSNPSVMMAAGILAKKAVERGLEVKPWVKTSLAPGSRVVTDYLKDSGLMPYLERLKFHLVGYGCTTCIGNSGPLPEHVSAAVKDGGLVVAAVLSGNRNFEGRINPQVRANYLASPPLVVAYALAGKMDIDLASEPLGHDKSGKPVFLSEVWPSQKEVLTPSVLLCARRCLEKRTKNHCRATIVGRRSRLHQASFFNGTKHPRTSNVRRSSRICRSMLPI